jgi:hypothetical protein
MAKQTIATGTAANDGTGDTLRQGADKINSNFSEIYNYIGNGSTLNSAISFDSYNIIFEGTSADAFETTLTAANPTADRTVTIPNHGGYFILDSATQTLTNKTLDSATINNPLLDGIKIQDDDASHQYTFVGGSLTSNHNITLPNITSNDVILFADATQTITNKTLTSPNFTADLNDVNGNEVIKFNATASADTEITVTNANSGTPKIAASGAATNINLELDGKGNGLVVLSPAFTNGTHTANGIVDSDTTVTIFSGTNHEAYLGDGATTGDLRIFLNTSTTANITVMKASGAATALFRKGSSTATQMVLKPGGSAQVVWDGTYWNPIGYGFDSTGSDPLVDF